MKSITFVAVCALSFLSAKSQGREYNVPKDFLTIQEAVDQCNSGDSVILAPGVYRGKGNRDIVFKGKRVIVRGTNPDDPNVVESTIIDCEASQEDPHCAFNLHSNGPYSPVIAGLTITRASPIKSLRSGSGVLAYQGNVIILNCRFVDNIGTPFFAFSCNVVVRNCEFRSNTGAGIMLQNCSADIIDCIVADNQQGGIDIANCAALIENCIITDNFNIYDGGGIRISSDDVAVRNCTIRNNHTERNGGGCYVRSEYRWIIQNCIIERNIADQDGGGIYGVGLEGGGQVINSRIVENCATGEGGGISRFKGRVFGCVLQGNSAEDGGGVSNCDLIEACTLSENKATDEGGGVRGASLLRNCIITGNHALRYGDAEWFKQMINCTLVNNSSESEVKYGNQQSLIRNCIIRDNPRSSLQYHKNIYYSCLDFEHDNKTNIQQNPLFASLLQSDFLLRPDSPCIDLDSPEDEYSLEPEPNGGRINIGAYGNTSRAASKSKL